MRLRCGLWFVALGSVVGCTTNSSGHLEAPPGGDLTRPAVRASPIDELRHACGDGAPTAAGAALQRQPYLQQVTTESAMLGWTTTGGPENVEVTLPDRTPVTKALAAEDQGTVRKHGQRQMWATIEGLEPDTIYCYALVDGAQVTARTGFRTAPLADDESPVRILAFGDSGGGGNDQETLLAQMYAFPYELMVHTGDVAYENGELSEFDANVFDVYADLFRNIPFYPAAGNHDYRTASAAPFRSVFALPGHTGEKWYSYDWGRVHFAALDTEADYETQARWLDDDLAASSLPWKIVYLHRPPYSSGEHGSDLALREALAPIVARHDVQLVLAGHDHNYERMLPQNGVAYVVTGGGGRGTRPVGSSSFTAFAADVIHFLYIEVGVDELVMHAIDGTGVEFDSMAIAR